jgi:hypothetical protein
MPTPRELVELVQRGAPARQARAATGQAMSGDRADDRASERDQLLALRDQEIERRRQA